MITDYFMITEKSNRLQVIMITDYDYPISVPPKIMIFLKPPKNIEIQDFEPPKMVPAYVYI